MKNSDYFFEKALEYQNKRKDIVDAYDKRVEQLEDTKGSKYYTDEMKTAKRTRDDSLQALKSEYCTYFYDSIDAMEKANSCRSIKPPTEEELRTIQLLKLKDNVTEQELSSAAQTLKGNTTCLAILTEMAQKQGYFRGYMGYADSKEMAVETAADIVESIKFSIRDFVNYDTTRASRITRERNEQQYGVNPNALPLQKRRLFETKAEFYNEIAGLNKGMLEEFCDVIDKD